MPCYRDMWFCSYYQDCATANTCHRALTPDVLKAAERWWGKPGAPIDTTVNKPTCHTEITA